METRFHSLGILFLGSENPYLHTTFGRSSTNRPVCGALLLMIPRLMHSEGTYVVGCRLGLCRFCHIIDPVSHAPEGPIFRCTTDVASSIVQGDEVAFHKVYIFFLCHNAYSIC